MAKSRWFVLAGVVSMSACAVFFLTSMRDGEASFVVPLMYSTLLFASVLDYWAGLPGDW